MVSMETRNMENEFDRNNRFNGMSKMEIFRKFQSDLCTEYGNGGMTDEWLMLEDEFNTWCNANNMQHLRDFS